jgi:hypothetical protein
MDALAVLESARFEWLGRDHHGDSVLPIQSSLDSDRPSPYLFSQSISVSDALPIVRRAVRIGILNDLGSGSHVDLCVISSDGGVRRWREQLVSSWEADKATQRIKELERVQGDSLDGPDSDNGGGSVGTVTTSSAVFGPAADDIAALSRELLSTCPDDTSNIIISNNDMSKTDTCSGTNTIIEANGVLGRKVFSRRRLVRCLQGGVVKELWMHNTIENDLSMEVEVL